MAQDRIQTDNTAPARAGRRLSRKVVLSIGVAGFFAVLLWSGVTAFERSTHQPVALAMTGDRPEPRPLGQRPAPNVEIEVPPVFYEEVGVVDEASTATTRSRASAASAAPAIQSAGVKLDRLGNIIMVGGRPWTGETFDHRPIRPVKTQTMKTTAYSPDERSCGKWADGITASGKSVWMNGGRLVAADRKVPYGTILTIPGYNNGRPVQVWDRGGKIKGNRLDVLYPTHEIARQWGVQDLPVVFWEFVEAD